MTQEPTHDAPNSNSEAGPVQSEPQPRSSIVKLLQILVIGAIIAFVGVGAFLLTSSKPATKQGPQVMAYRNERPPASVKYVDGLVISSLTQEIRLMLKNRSERVIHVRAPDKPYIDIQHAQTHAALGQPVRLYYKRVGGKDCAVFMEDSPVAF